MIGNMIFTKKNICRMSVSLLKKKIASFNHIGQGYLG
jgi:hypothetical protein